MARKKSLAILECTREHPKVREIFLPKLESERERERGKGANTRSVTTTSTVDVRSGSWHTSHWQTSTFT